MRISDWSSDVCSSDLPQAEQHHADKDEEHQQGYPQGEAQPCHRAYLRSRRSRPPSATRPPAATISPPSQISVTNGFHQICTCQRPSASALPSTPSSCPFPKLRITAPVVSVTCHVKACKPEERRGGKKCVST